MSSSFIDRLQDEILVADGAMGTMLYARGVYINRCFDELNLSNPKLVKDVHKEYIEAGADIIETNTFGANWHKLLPHGLEKKLYEINHWGALLAKEVAGTKHLVAGSIGPLNLPMKPFGNLSAEEANQAFQEQAQALIDGGVDLLILETFNDLNMLEVAVKAVQQLTSKPIIAQMSFSEGTKTIYGVTPVQVVQRLELLNVAVIGINCSTGPQPILEAIEQMAKVSHTKLSAMPNAGMPKFVEGRLLYLTSPEYFAEYAKRFIQTGVSIIGGCCGTTPEHIRAVKAAVKALRPTRLVEKIRVLEKKEKIKTRLAVIKSDLQQKLSNHHFITCIEINPPRCADVTKVVCGCQSIKEKGCSAVNIPDGPRASARMSPLALATIIESQVGINTILHYTCRDRNILGIQSDLLGAYALGLRNILCVTGDPPKMGDYPTATAVFNVDSIGLLRIANNLNHGLDLAGNPIEKATAFFLGAGVNPGAINFPEEIERLKHKIEVGAEYILTQPLFEYSIFEQFLEQVIPLKIPIFAGILPLASYRNAEFLHNEVPGMRIPQKILDRLHAAQNNEEAQNIGIDVAQQMVLQVKPHVQGVYLMPPFGRYQSALKVLEIIR